MIVLCVRITSKKQLCISSLNALAVQWNVQGQSLSDAGGAKMNLLFAILHGHFHDCNIEYLERA
jgi:hypothetical protein